MGDKNFHESLTGVTHSQSVHLNHQGVGSARLSHAQFGRVVQGAGFERQSERAWVRTAQLSLIFAAALHHNECFNIRTLLIRCLALLSFRVLKIISV